MTDAHCHVPSGDGSVRELVVGRDFYGVHPWECVGKEEGRGKREEVLEGLRERLLANPRVGVGEIGLDRLREKTIPPVMREIFEAQLRLAFELCRPVVLHGAKCWGQVLEAVRRFSSALGQPPALLFHGFSRSGGLVSDIVELGGYISVGPAILNDHAVNYRALVAAMPSGSLLVETDRTDANAAECPGVREILEKLAEVRGESVSALEAITDENAARFMPEVG